MAFTLATDLVPGCAIDQILTNESSVTIQAHSTTNRAACPNCAQLSSSVHTYYTRSPQDLPIGAKIVRLQLRVRRFRCHNTSCTKRTFSERLPQLLPPFAQKTERFITALYHTAQALGGAAAARLLLLLQLPTSATTLLRIIRRLFSSSTATPRVVGVDDWAKRKGTAYGTILVDLERHQVIDLLPDRTAETVEQWLKDHPDIEVVTRDRSTEYARGITNGAPQAQQVADRWHLLLNLRQMLERLISHWYQRLKLLPTMKAISGKEKMVPKRESFRRTASERAVSQASRAKRLARYQEIQQRKHSGQNIRQIALALKLTRITVRLYYYTEEFPERNVRRPLPSILDPFLPYLERRLQEGCENASQLWREIQEKGYAGTRRQVSRWVQIHRTQPSPSSRKDTLPVSSKPPVEETILANTRANDILPSARQLAWLLVLAPEALSMEEKAVLQRIQQDAEVEIVYQLAQQFMNLVRQHESGQLDLWLESCAQSGVGNLQTFAEGIQRDYSAVAACLKTSYSNGQTEGQVNRLKCLKRQMYGRANLDLLRIRMLYSPPLHQR
jgi:transposase